jgi:hypothetical protein
MGAKENYETFVRQADRWMNYFLDHVTEGDANQGLHGNGALAQRIRNDYQREIVLVRNAEVRQIKAEERRDPRATSLESAVRVSRQYADLEETLSRTYDRFVDRVVNLHRRTDRCDCARYVC